MHAQPINALDKVATRIAGLDDILRGGLPAGRTTLVKGGPGTGKSMLGLESLYRAATAGEPGIYVTFEERAADVRRNAATLGWDVAALEQAGMLFLFEARVDPAAILSGDFNLTGLLAIIAGQSQALQATRIVMDAVDVLLQLFNDPVRERNELYLLHDWLQKRNLTTLLTVKTTIEEPAAYTFLDFMADCVIELNQRVTNQITTRRLHVIKYRGSGFGHNEYPFVILENGINLIPLSSAALQHHPLGAMLSSGHDRLDRVLGGGYRRAACILIAGAPGSGKTTMVSTFAHAACARGEKVLYINFEESQDAIVMCMRSPGIDLRPAVAADRLRFLNILPEAVGAEEHLLRALLTIQAFQPDHVIVEAISSCRRMGSMQVAFEYILRLVNACKERNITTFLTNQANNLFDVQEISGIGMSSIADTAIFLRYIESGGEINRTLLVMKARAAKHSNQYREFLITDQGIALQDVYVGEGGVLTGVARREQDALETENMYRRTQAITLKQLELAQKRAALHIETDKLHAEIKIKEAELEALRLDAETIRKRGDIRATLRGRDRDGLVLDAAEQPDPLSAGGDQ